MTTYDENPLPPQNTDDWSDGDGDNGSIGQPLTNT